MDYYNEYGTLTETGARTIASNWHGGQASPLYAFASSGAIVPGIIREIRNNIRSIRDNESGLSYGDGNREIGYLADLINYVQGNPSPQAIADAIECGDPDLAFEDID